jgi:hypothetical protein
LRYLNGGKSGNCFGYNSLLFLATKTKTERSAMNARQKETLGRGAVAYYNHRNVATVLAADTAL